MASSLRVGVDVRGSIALWRAGSKVVTVDRNLYGIVSRELGEKVEARG